MAAGQPKTEDGALPVIKPDHAQESVPPQQTVQPKLETGSLPVIKPDRLPDEGAAKPAAMPLLPPDLFRKPEETTISPSTEITPDLPEVPPPQPERPLLKPEKTMQKQGQAKRPLPSIKPDRPSQPARRSIKPVAPPAITPQAARTQLASRGWRFKTAPADKPNNSQRIIQTAANLDKPSSSGAPLADEPRSSMEGMLGRDFGDVRVHQADLGPLNVQAATRGRDVFFDKGQDNFDRPEGMALLGHELTHVGQSGVAQTKPTEPSPAASPIMRMPAAVESDEAEANRVEQSVYRQAQTGALPLARPAIQRAEIPETDMPDAGPEGNSFLNDIDMDDHYDQVQGQQETYQERHLELKTDLFEARQTNDETTFAELQDTLEEMIDERMAEMMEAMGLDETENEETPQPSLDDLARQILPYFKRLIVVERERRAV